jgi:hypothetical protein
MRGTLYTVFITRSSRGVLPFSSTRMFTCEMSKLNSLPRTVLRLAIPFLSGLKPGGLRISTRFLPLPWTSGRIGNPAESLPPVIFNLYPGRPNISPSIISPTCLPAIAFVFASSNSYWMAFPVSGSEITSLNGNYRIAYLNQWYVSYWTLSLGYRSHFMRVVVGRLSNLEPEVCT